jgi:uncharacterized protein DUF6069
METTQQRPVDTAAPCTRRSGVGAVAAVAMTAASVVWTGARIAGLDLEVHSGSGTSEVTLGPVIVVPMLATILAVSLLRRLERRTTRGLRIWTIVATAVWALSFLGPLSATRPATGLVLAGMHLVVGAVIVFGLRRTHATSSPVA